MLKGDADSVSTITSDFQKKKGGYCKASYFIEIKKINLKLLILLYSFYFYCIWTFFGFAKFKLDFVSIADSTLNLSLVDKEVFLGVFSLDETKSFCLVKPFYRAGFHIVIPQKNTMYNCIIKAIKQKKCKN